MHDNWGYAIMESAVSYDNALQNYLDNDSYIIMIKYYAYILGFVCNSKIVLYSNICMFDVVYNSIQKFTIISIIKLSFYHDNSIHCKFCKFTLGVTTSATNLAVYGELGHLPLMISRKLYTVKYWLRLVH